MKQKEAMEKLERYAKEKAERYAKEKAERKAKEEAESEGKEKAERYAAEKWAAERDVKAKESEAKGTGYYPEPNNPPVRPSSFGKPRSKTSTNSTGSTK